MGVIIKIIRTKEVYILTSSAIQNQLSTDNEGKNLYKFNELQEWDAFVFGLRRVFSNVSWFLFC